MDKQSNIGENSFFLQREKKFCPKPYYGPKKILVIFGVPNGHIYTFFRQPAAGEQKFEFFRGAQWCNIYTFFRHPAACKNNLRFFGGNMVQYRHIFHTLLSFVRFFVLCPIFFVRSFVLCPLFDPLSFVL